MAWRDDHIAIVDQTLLPARLLIVELRSVDEVVGAIRRLAVRGAPAIGVTGALGVALAAATDEATLTGEAARIRAARPTAVNLAWAVDRVLSRHLAGPDAMLEEALAILAEEVAASRAIGERGADLVWSLIGRPVAVQTHCNAGALATIEWGTALGVVRSLHQRGAINEVFVDETRPLLQGARLTAWELARMGVPYRVVVDGAGPTVIARGMADVVVVGADRVAANGDVANKIGTYPLALAAARAGIPFVVAAPESTVDLATAHGAAIPIEERDPMEVVAWAGVPTAPSGAGAFNPAFDITPADLVTAVVTERRVVRPSAGEALI